MIEVQRNPDLRIGMYYVMECYELGFSEMEWGTCRMLILKNGENGEPLNYEGITARELNMEKFRKHLNDFENGIMPNQAQKSRNSRKPRRKSSGGCLRQAFSRNHRSERMKNQRNRYAKEKGSRMSIGNG